MTLAPRQKPEDRFAGTAWVTLWLAATAAGMGCLYAGAGWLRAGVVLFVAAAVFQCGWPAARVPLVARRVILLGSAVAHLVCLLLPPWLSDDLYRYLVDGSLVAQGYNPYAWAPSSPKLSGLVPASHVLVNHPGLHTIYPPVAQAAFGLVCLVAAHPLAWKSAMAVTGWGMALWWYRRGEEDASLRLVSHPLVLLAASLNGHVDTLGIALVTAIVATGHSRFRSGLWIGLAAGVKLFPLALAALWLRQGVRKTALVGTVAVALLVGSYLPVWSAGPKSFGSLGTYAAHWEYNAGPAAVVGATVQTGLRWLEVRDPLEIPATLAGSGRPAIRYFDGVATEGLWWTHRELGLRLGRVAALIVLLGVALAVWRYRWPPVRSAAWLLTAIIVMSPTVHPWYLLWVVPLAVQPKAPFWLRWLCAVHVLGFWSPAQEADLGVWRDELWVRLVVWGSWAGVCVWWLSGHRSRVSTSSPHAENPESL